MSGLFLSIINMSLTASYVILFVILVRLVLKKFPKGISYALWIVVAFRLIIPFSFESMFSLMLWNTNTALIRHDVIYNQSPQVNNGIVAVDSFVNNSLPAATVGESINPLQIYVEIGAYIWVLGIIALLVYGFISALRLHKQLESAELVENNIYKAKNLKTPFVLGLMRPRIYLPLGLSIEERSFILLHEQTHIKRKDHIIKILAFLILSLHWFNPLVWLAFILMSKDMELSCDERVLKEIDEDIKKPYANSLLSLATRKHILNGSPLAFCEGNVKGRIKNVLNYKRPKFWLIVISIIIVMVVGIGLITNPKDKETDKLDQINSIVWEIINKDIENLESNPEVKIIDSKITRLELVETFDELVDTPIDVYALEYRLLPEDLSKVALAGGMDYDENGWLKEKSSMGSPFLVVSRDDDSVNFVGVLWTGELGDMLSSQEIAVRSLLEGLEKLPQEIFTGNHSIAKFKLSTGEMAKAFLSQPATQGEHGIWCVERWMDGNGNIYYHDPQKESLLKDYYNELQMQSDNGHKPWLLNPSEVALEFTNHTLGQSVEFNNIELINNASVEDFLSYKSQNSGAENLENDLGEKMNFGFDVEGNLSIIMSSPKASSNPQDYIRAHKEEYEEFIKYGGEEALQYMLSQFETENAEGLRGQIMMLLCKELLGVRNNVSDESLSPQEWYTALNIRQEINLPNFEYDGQDPIEKLIYATEIDKAPNDMDRGFTVIAPKIFGSYEEDNLLKVFATTFYARYLLFDNVLSMDSAGIIPVAITYQKDESGGYTLLTYEQARDGSEFASSIREYCTMPVSGKEIKGLADKIFTHYGDYEDIRILMRENLYKHLKENGITDATLTNSQGEVEFNMKDFKSKQ